MWGDRNSFTLYRESSVAWIDCRGTFRAFTTNEHVRIESCRNSRVAWQKVQLQIVNSLWSEHLEQEVVIGGALRG